MNVQVDGNKKHILLSTIEGYPKDNTIQSKKRNKDRNIHFTFTGPDAPTKAVKAIMQKYGIQKEEL
jgi:hypothetical protein